MLSNSVISDEPEWSSGKLSPEASWEGNLGRSVFPLAFAWEQTTSSNGESSYVALSANDSEVRVEGSPRPRPSKLLLIRREESVVPRAGEMLHGDGKGEKGSRTRFWMSGDMGGTSSTCSVVSGIDVRRGKEKLNKVLVFRGASLLAAYRTDSIELANMDVWGEMRDTLRVSTSF